ncbi:hypothetical protein Fmac_032449 [Flemingia macrophylla]|uniref:Uncharacterized protein n=1 Tax=Flemingia macrophylla TaxID=520843 RepID=A0ABD1L5C8_9FABA
MENKLVSLIDLWLPSSQTLIDACVQQPPAEDMHLNTFIWKLLHNGIPTYVFLRDRGSVNESKDSDQEFFDQEFKMNSRNPQRSKISPCQVAIHIQRYLILNNFTNSASHFRQEAGTLIAEAVAKKEVPSSVLCLEQMLDEYTLLKEQKVLVDQEWATLMQERTNFKMMVQNFMNTYGIYQKSQAPMMITNCARVPQPCVSIVATTPQNTSHQQLLPMSIKSNLETRDFSTPMIFSASNSRKRNEVLNYPTVAKKRRGRPPGSKNRVPNTHIKITPVVATFNVEATPMSHASHIPTWISPIVASCNGEATPRTDSSHIETDLSPTMVSTAACNVEPTPTLIPIEKVAVSSTQKTGQGDHCTSRITGEPGMVDPVKVVLDSFTSEFDKEVDISNPNYPDSGMAIKSLLDVFESEFDKDVDISGFSYSESDMELDLGDLEFV